MEVKLLSMNVADSPVNFGRAKRMGVLGEEVKKLNPDVVFFQEFVSKKSVEALKKAMKGYSFLGGDSPMENGGLLVASILPYIGKGAFRKFDRQAYWFPLSWSDKYLGKGFFSFSVKAGGRPIHMVDLHTMCNYLQSDAGERALREQLMQLAGYVKKQKGKLIVSGDFNLVSGTDLYKDFIDSSGLYDPLEKNPPETYNSEEIFFLVKGISKKLYGGRKLDYTLFKGFKPKDISQRVVFNRPVFRDGKKMFLSDHYGLFTKVRV